MYTVYVVGTVLSTEYGTYLYLVRYKYYSSSTVRVPVLYRYEDKRADTVIEAPVRYQWFNLPVLEY